jgi:KUP system potassium uptake protein
MSSGNSGINKISVAGLIVTLGIVYGDIGTSPLYVMSAIVRGMHHLETDFILGALSCIIWTLTLQTTLKYVLITLRADNKGEGGIFALFALIRRRYRWAFFLAIIGGSALLADGVITPSITVVSAIEGLQIMNASIPVIPIVLVIITMLFLFQQFGTETIGKSYGPIMFFWFLILALVGFNQIIHFPKVFLSFNPYYAYKFLTFYPGGFILLGAVFLCTTGAEALYSDLGHCGLGNIRITWWYVKITLILNYLGQGAWILSSGEATARSVNPFFGIMPNWFLMPGVIIATMAAVIASQALLSGSFTIISEAISLNFWPRMKKSYPTFVRGQVYIPGINWFLFINCVLVILFFRESAKMEAAYGLAITITMIMTTFLLSMYLSIRRVAFPLVILLLIVYCTIEGAFLIANLTKFMHGGWYTILLASIISIIMYAIHHTRKIRNKFMQFVRLPDYIDIINELSEDESIPKFATNLVYITRANFTDEIESRIIYSIINKQPKRADVYWFVHVDILDEPNTFEYEINEFIPGKMVKIDFRLGFKMEPRINMYFKQVIEDMVANNEIDMVSRYPSLRKHGISSDFQFIVIDRIPNYDYDFSAHDKFVITIYQFIRFIGIPEVRAFGLDTSNVIIEKVPLIPDGYGHKRVISRRIHTDD